MRLVTIPGKILRKDAHTLLIMGDGDTRQAVCFLHGPAGTEDVQERLDLIEEAANLKALRGEVAFDGQIWITAADLPKSNAH